MTFFKNPFQLSKSYSKIVIGIVLIVCTWYGKNLDSWGRNRVIDNDVVCYYGYLPATFIFHDLNFNFFKDLPKDFNGKIWYAKAPNGKPVLRMTMGLAILWIPFFGFGHGLAHIKGVSTLGYSWPYSFSIFLAALFYLLIGLILLRKILLKYYPDWIAAITIAIVVVATNLMYYVISEPGMSHVYSFSAITAFLYVTLKWIDKPTWVSSLILGLLAGMIVLIRPINGLVLVFPACIGVSTFAGFKNRLVDYWKFIAIAAGGAFIMVLPQMIYWKAQTGHFLFNSYMDQSKFFFLDPKIGKGLLGFRKGWLIYTPVMFFSLGGLLVMGKYAKELRNATILFLLLFIYVTFSWWCWWYGGSFGARTMIETYGILAIPLAASLTWLFQKKIWLKTLTGILLVALLYLNQFQMGQYRTSMLHYSSMTKEAYKAIFLKKKWPAGYDKMIKVPDYQKALQGDRD